MKNKKYIIAYIKGLKQRLIGVFVFNTERINTHAQNAGYFPFHISLAPESLNL